MGTSVEQGEKGGVNLRGSPLRSYDAFLSPNDASEPRGV